MRKHISSGAPWESIVGYSRAVRVGHTIEVSGTVSVKDGKPYGVGDAYQQALQALSIIQASIEELGGTLQDVIRTRMYVTDIKRDWEAIGKAHGTYFSDIRPATTMVEVNALIDPDYLVEIEATAVLHSAD